MNRIVLFEDEGFANLLPLVYWRSVFELRHGRRIILDRLAQVLEAPILGVWTRDWIAKVAQERCGAPANVGTDGSTVLVNGRWVVAEPVRWPSGPHVGLIDNEVAYIVCDDSLAIELTPGDLLDAGRCKASLKDVPCKQAPGHMIHYPWDLVCGLADVLAKDWNPGDAGIEIEIDRRVCLENTDLIHIGRGSQVHPTASISAANGPVFISENVHLSAHCVVEGPIYIGAGSRINPHAWLHGGNSIGPVCKVGGEVDGCVFQGFANKQHDGFLGHSFIGSWVNLGAQTVNSDLKHTYGSVKVPINGTEVDTAQTFFGAIIGDHVKTAINTTIPTGAVIGMAAMVATGNTLPKFVPSFGWLTDSGLADGDPGRLLDVATKVMARRDVDMTDAEVELFLELSSRAREFETAAQPPVQI